MPAKPQRSKPLDGETVESIVYSVSKVYGRRVARAVEARLRDEPRAALRLVSPEAATTRGDFAAPGVRRDA